MKDLMVTIFGSYEPIYGIDGVAGMDWEYILGVVLFAIVLYSFFRLVGMVLK